MYLLVIDTSSQTCSVAIFKNSQLKIEITTTNSKTHSKDLLSIIDNAFYLAKIDISEIDYFAIVKGPGSFTGLRIGISTIKAFCFTHQKKVCTISSLEALASSCSTSKLICPIIDARKNELYFSFYKYEFSVLKEKKTENVLSLDKICKKIKEPCLFVGSGVIQYKELIKKKLKKNAFFINDNSNFIKASTVGILALNKIKNGFLEEASNIRPHYIRKSDAEINKKTIIQRSL